MAAIWYPCGSTECQAITPTGDFRTTDTFVPVYPASHGCVRVPMDIANFFHNLVKTPGTEVFVYK